MYQFITNYKHLMILFLIYVFRDDSVAHKNWGDFVTSSIDVFHRLFYFSTTFISLISIWQQSAINEARGRGVINMTQTDDAGTEPKHVSLCSDWCFLLRLTATCHRHVSPIWQGQYVGTKLSWQADMGTASWVYEIKTNKQSSELTCF